MSRKHRADGHLPLVDFDKVTKSQEKSPQREVVACQCSAQASADRLSGRLSVPF
jgi:hypothetical protein